MTKPPTIGYVLWEGRSRLTGAPTVAIVNGIKSSSNRKTGAMLQTWIIRSDISPADAVKRKQDDAICGDCPQRLSLGGACYVNVAQAPQQVYRSYKAGRYDKLDLRKRDHRKHIVGRKLRLGAYGEPPAVPRVVWERLLRICPQHTGYTHRWRDAGADYKFLMASCDSADDYHNAKALGWRTFRNRKPWEPLEPNERTCPAADEAGKRVTCDQCCLCNGLNGNKKIDIAIIGHGKIERARQKRYYKINIGCK